MQLTWEKCQGDIWGLLMDVDLSHPHFNNMNGVYIIWQQNGPVIRIGQGVIQDRLMAHRNDTAITAYSSLYVTWASVGTLHRDNVERYLANVLSPVVGDAFPDVAPIQVPLPWPWKM